MDQLFHDWFNSNAVGEMINDFTPEQKAKVMTLCFTAWNESRNTIAVDKPSHYAQEGEPECIDYLEAALSPDEYNGFIKGNVLKYLWRMNKKNGEIDRRKAIWYANRLIDERGGTV